MSAATSFAYETFAPDRKLMSLDHFSHSQLSILTSLAGEDPAGADRPTLLDTLTKRMQNTSEQDWTLTDRLGKTPGRRGGLLCSYEDQLNIVGGARSADQAFNIRCDPMSRLWEPVQRKREPLDGLLERPCGLQLYELDLLRWIWRRLLVSDIPFYYDSTEDGGDTIATALVQNCLMVYGGSIESGDDDAFVNQLHVFNFTTMSWSKPPLPENRMGYRSGHMATNHDHLIIAGGECEDDEVERVLCINAHARPHDRYLVDDKLRNFQLATASHRDLFTDAVITVGGRDFAVHRAVLASASPYFERIFSTQMQEGLTGKAVLSEMNPETFSLAVSWMYGTTDRSLSAREAIDLFMVEELRQYAKLLGLKSLAYECKRHLSKSTHGLCALNGFPYHPMANGMLSWSGPVPETAPENHDSPELHASNQQRQSATQLLSRQEDTDFTEAAQEADDIGSVVDIEEVSWIEELQEFDSALGNESSKSSQLDSTLAPGKTHASRSTAEDRVQASKPAVEPSAILANLPLCSRMAARPLVCTQGQKQQAQSEGAELGIILNKAPGRTHASRSTAEDSNKAAGSVLATAEQTAILADLHVFSRHPMRLSTTLEAVMASRNNRLPSDSVALRGISFVGAPGVSLICMPQPLQCGAGKRERRATVCFKQLLDVVQASQLPLLQQLDVKGPTLEYSGAV
ncbi:hypothetical protein WJX82_008748 [Trebouxia sp. C0006]